MRNRTALGLSLLLCCGCAGASRRPPAAFKLSPELLKAKAEAYEHYHVERVDGHVAEIDGYRYQGPAALAYYRASGAEEAAGLAQKGMDDWQQGNAATALWMSGGGAIGAIPGYIAAANTYDSFGVIRAAVLGIGILSGVVLGGACGLSAKYGVYRPRAKEKFKKAGDSFNRYLQQELQWDASGASLHF